MKHLFKTKFLVFIFLLSFICKGQAADLAEPMARHLTWSEAQAQYAQLKQEFHHLEQADGAALMTNLSSLEALKVPLKAKAIACADTACLQALQEEIKKIDEDIESAQYVANLEKAELQHQFILYSRAITAMARVDILTSLVSQNVNVAHFEVEADGSWIDSTVVLRTIFKSSPEIMFETLFTVIAPAFCEYSAPMFGGSSQSPPVCDIDAELKLDAIFAKPLSDLDGALIDSVNKVVDGPSDDLVAKSGDENNIHVSFNYSLDYQRKECMSFSSLKNLCQLLNP